MEHGVYNWNPNYYTFFYDNEEWEVEGDASDPYHPCHEDWLALEEDREERIKLCVESKSILEANNKLIDEKMAELRELKRKNLKKIGGIKWYLEHEIPEGTTYEKDLIKISYRKSKQVEVLVDPSKLPEAYQRVKIEANKTAIKQCFERGVSFDGLAQIVEKQNIQIKG